ncbi:MAG: hypothetical protein QE487_08845 [Fluviicola sp.]|nr:hypothetical protein [Fluviicola sp.]
MRLLSQLQFSINGIFELYITQGRRFYGFSILFAIFSSIWSVILGLIVVYVYFIIASLLDLNPTNFNKRFFDNGDSWYYATNAAAFIMIINMSLYAIALNRFKRVLKERLSFGGFFRSINSSTWGLYFICSSAGVIIMNLLTDFATPSPNYAGGSMQQLLNSYEGSSATNLFFSFFVFLLQFTPVVLGFLILYRSLKKTGIELQQKEVGRTLVTVIILSFVIYIGATSISTFVNNYIVRLISMPFQEPLIPSILTLVIYVFLIGVFYLGFASSFLLPFLFHENDEVGKRDIILNENSPIDEL